MKSIFLVIQIVLSLALVGSILLQSQGSGLGATWGGGGESYHTKRGVEKVLLYATGIMISLFALLSLLIAVSDF